MCVATSESCTSARFLIKVFGCCGRGIKRGIGMRREHAAGSARPPTADFSGQWRRDGGDLAASPLDFRTESPDCSFVTGSKDSDRNCDTTSSTSFLLLCLGIGPAIGLLRQKETQMLKPLGS